MKPLLIALLAVGLAACDSSRNFMVEGGAKSEVVDLQDQEQKGLHYIFDFVSGRFAGPGT